jgi:hypothetical protein
MIFAVSRIDVLVLPAHSSHLLQLFDGGVAASLKVAFNQELDRRIERFADLGPGQDHENFFLQYVGKFRPSAISEPVITMVIALLELCREKPLYTGINPFTPV